MMPSLCIDVEIDIRLVLQQEVSKGLVEQLKWPVRKLADKVLLTGAQTQREYPDL
jgi:hypothetical protein